MGRGRGLYKRGNIWWLRYSDISGKIRRESSESTSYETAKNMLIEKRKEVKDGKNPPKKLGNYGFNDLCDVYIKSIEHQRYSKTKILFIKKMSDYYNNIRLNHFGVKEVEEFRSLLLSKGKKPSTCNRYLACLRHMFTKAVEYEMINDDILKKVRRVKLLPENNKRTRFLSIDECRRLIESCSDDIKPIVIIALNTGMRKSEILKLEWNKNIDLVHNIISITKTKNNDKRDIPINDMVKSTLNNMIRRIDQLYVFVRKDGGRYKTIDKKFWKARNKAELGDLRFHDLRHTFASQLVMAGIDIMTVKELLGHKSLTMTMRYAHLSQSHRSNAVRVLGGKFDDHQVHTLVYNE